MESQEMNIKKVIFSIDFGIGTILVALLMLMFVSAEIGSLIVPFILSFIFAISLVGFFMYIYTPGFVLILRRKIQNFNRFLPLLGVWLVFVLYRLAVPTSRDPLQLILQLIFALILISVPSLLYAIFPHEYTQGLSFVDVVAGLWVWMPVEFGFIDDFVGSVNEGGLPIDTLLLLFAFMYGLIFIRNHDLGLTFTLSKSDIILVGKITGILTFIILPLGILTSFLAPLDIIWSNLMEIVSDLPGSLGNVVLTFVMIFLGIALIEEMYFRGFVHNLLAKRFEQDTSMKWWYVGLVLLIILISITPWIDDILGMIAQLFPPFQPIKSTIGSLADPLGDHEGRTWNLVINIPIEILYIAVAVTLGLIAAVIIQKTQDPIIAALMISSILFGWAHFEDLRYIFFASIAGAGYGYSYWKTEKIVPAALVHMAVDAVWSLLFTFPAI